MSAQFTDLLGSTQIVPVITVHDVEHAVPLATALVAGGLPVIEVTLRTDAALPAIERIVAAVPGAVVGAGTVCTAEQYAQSLAAGAEFIVSPGCTDALLVAAATKGGAFLPGAATASEIMRLLDHGFSTLKFFPAQSSGGVGALRSFAGPFPGVTFCPTGGIDRALAVQYLALPNVVCIGGSWMVGQQLIAAGDWDAISALAADAAMAVAA